MYNLMYSQISQEGEYGDWFFCFINIYPLWYQFSVSNYRKNVPGNRNLKKKIKMAHVKLRNSLMFCITSNIT